MLFVFAFVFTAITIFHFDNTNTPSGLSSSTAYYKNGSNFYTLSSSVQHYKCTNSRHSGANDYTTSSVSGTCYQTFTTKYYSHSVSKIYGSHSCSAVYGSHNVLTKHTYGTHYAGGKQFLDGDYKAKCQYCGAIKDVYWYQSGPFTWGQCTSNVKSTTYECSYCSKTSSSSFSGTCYSNITSYKCSHCQKTFTSNSTAQCTSNVTGYKCSYCGKTSSSSFSGSCSSRPYTSKTNHNHSLSKSYMLYTYKNIDTNTTTTSQSSFSRATGYTISFNANGGSGSMSSQYFLHGHSQQISKFV